MYTEQLPSGRYRHQLVFIEERTGKRKKVSVTTDKDTQKARREAEAILNEKIRAINAGYSENRDTLREAFDDYITAKSAVWRPGSIRRNTYAAKALCDLLDGDTLLTKLTARHVSDRFSRSGKSATTLNELLARLKAFLSWCWDTERIEDISWTKKLRPYPEPSARQKNALKYLERDELVRLLPELDVELNRYIIHFLALSGLRVGECLALTKKDVDLAGRVIHVTKTADPATGKVLDGAKTDTSNRDVYIQDELLRLCREMLKYMRRTSVAFGFRSDLFFCDLDGHPVPYARLNKYFAENTLRVIGRRLTLHSLRHTHASLMFEGGATLEAVSLRLGHADSKVTKDIYVHVTKRLREQYNQSFDRIHIIV